MQGSSSRAAHHIFNMHLNACKDGDLLGKICIYSRTMKLRRKKKSLSKTSMTSNTQQTMEKAISPATQAVLATRKMLHQLYTSQH